jgi:hypothetical protein
VAKIPDLWELQVDGKEQAGADQQVDELGRAADETVQRGEYLIQCVHCSPS